ncbi:hypothetical protein P8452_71029 [Trifolium repens]|nr:hypothetical protein P8452_69251 [Trifolium repens]WJX89001.1 hypothetical protein P8452_71029 [Trifolium repens]
MGVFRIGELAAFWLLCVSKGAFRYCSYRRKLLRFEFLLFFRFQLLPPKPVAIRKAWLHHNCCFKKETAFGDVIEGVFVKICDFFKGR